MKEKKIGLSHNFIIHPGETVKEFLEERNMLQKELAMRCDVSEKYISTIICGEKNISDDFAERLDMLLELMRIFGLIFKVIMIKNY